MSSSMKNVWQTGPGLAMPVVSRMTRSKVSWPASRLARSSDRVRIRSPRTVQQTQPLDSSMISSSLSCTSRSLSMLSGPNSFSMTATRRPWNSVRMRLSRVVLPAPRKPVRMVTGTILSKLRGVFMAKLLA
ncbi:hypothetical protein D3C85_1413900 [compost metagenome]